MAGGDADAYGALAFMALCKWRRKAGPDYFYLYAQSLMFMALSVKGFFVHALED